MMVSSAIIFNSVYRSTTDKRQSLIKHFKKKYNQIREHFQHFFKERRLTEMH